MCLSVCDLEGHWAAIAAKKSLSKSSVEVPVTRLMLVNNIYLTSDSSPIKIPTNL